MRAAGILFLVVLIAAALVLMLRGREAVEAQRSVNRITGDIHEAGVQAAPFDEEEARRVMERLQDMARGRGELSQEELDGIVRRTASWAEGAPTPSAELTVAVALRKAAGELRQFLLDSNDWHLRTARREIARARRALAGETAQGGVEGLRDRLQNLQESERERLQELDKALQ